MTAIRGHETLAALGTTLPRLVLLYYGGAVVVGVIVGALLPLGKTAIGAAFVGAVSTLPLFGLFELHDTLAGAKSAPGWRSFAIGLAIVVGSVAGLIVRVVSKRFR